MTDNPRPTNDEQPMSREVLDSPEMRAKIAKAEDRARETASTTELFEAVRQEIYLSDPVAVAALDSLRTRMERLKQERDEVLTGQAYSRLTSELGYLRHKLAQTDAVVEAARAIDDYTNRVLDDSHPWTASGGIGVGLSHLRGALAALDQDEAHA